jgi:transmembrane sensor
LHTRHRCASSLSDRLALPEFAARVSNTLDTPLARRACVVAFLAIVLAALGVGFGPIQLRMPSTPHLPQESVYQTKLGGELTVVLPDNTKVKLGGATRLGVLFSNESRHVTLYRGEAMFAVAHSPRRPFQVDAAETRVTDEGTVFHIRYYSDQQIIVGVAEGVVAVARREPETIDKNSAAQSTSRAQSQSVTVRQGEEVSSDATGKITPAHPADFQAMVWWRDGLRVYMGKPLGKVIQDLQLYSPRQIAYDEGLATFLFTGIVNQNDPENWLRGLKHSFPVEIDDSNPRRLVIHCRQTGCRRQP